MLCICGSPRSGETEKALNEFCAKANGELVLLKDLDIRPCCGCLGCVKAARCEIVDDMGGLVEKMLKSDLVVFGVPNYFDNVPSIFKKFIDRLCPYCKMHPTGNNVLRGKKVIFIYVGVEDNLYTALHSAVAGMVKYLELDVVAEFTKQKKHR